VFIPDIDEIKHLGFHEIRRKGFYIRSFILMGIIIFTVGKNNNDAFCPDPVIIQVLHIDPDPGHGIHQGVIQYGGVSFCHIFHPDFVNLLHFGKSIEQFLGTYEYNDAGMATKMTYPDGNEHNFSYEAGLARLKTIQDGTEDFITKLDYNKSGVVKLMEYENDTWQTWDFDNRKRISHIDIIHTTGEIANLDYTINGSGDILSINDNEYTYDGFDRIVGAKTLIPGHTDILSLVRASFGTAESADPIEVEGEIRAYNALADTNSDGVIDGRDHAAACFIGEDEVYDIESFEYDKNGNRITLVQNGDEYRYTYGERNRLETIHRKKKGEIEESLYVEYEYDECGNTTKRTIYTDEGEEVITFEYDTMNRLVKTTEGADVTTYHYDNAGNRFIKRSPSGTTVYLRHGQIAVAMDIELPADTTEELGRVNRYVLSGDLLAGRITTIVPAAGAPTEEKSYYHLDHLNSTKCVTDVGGAVVVMYEYRAFGEQLKRLDNNGDETGDEAKYSYGGKELDDGTNLYYFNARYYDATIGRFINVDPVQ
jgi:RHS repeat-associated protein